jgi:hypothetical protein
LHSFHVVTRSSSGAESLKGSSGEKKHLWDFARARKRVLMQFPAQLLILYTGEMKYESAGGTGREGKGKGKGKERKGKETSQDIESVTFDLTQVTAVPQLEVGGPLNSLFS